MRVLVTGGSGFLGCHLVRRLLGDGHRVMLLASPRFRAARLGDVEGRYELVSNAAEAARFRPDVIYHLASTSFNPPGTPFGEHFRVIVAQTAELLGVFSGSGARFLQVGTGGEYGPGSHAGESAALEPDTLLGGCKAAASILAQTLGRLGELHTVVLRLFTPYGPYEAPHRLIPSIARAALRGEPVELASPDSTRDFCYAPDVIEAMLLAATAPLAPATALNICSGIEIRVRDLARLVLGAVGSPAEIHARPGGRPGEIARMSGSNQAARELLGWRPTTLLAEGIERTVSWFQHNPQWLRLDP